MKNILLLLLFCGLFVSHAVAQSDIKMRAEYGSDNVDVMSILQFENIGLEKMTFSGIDLKNKDFQIAVKEFVNGKLTKTEVVFDSKEDEYFKIKSDKFTFRVLTKMTPENTVKLQFQFKGFSAQKEYKVAAGQKEFWLKTFLGRQLEISIPLYANTYILGLDPRQVERRRLVRVVRITFDNADGRFNG